MHVLCGSGDRSAVSFHFIGSDCRLDMAEIKWRILPIDRRVGVHPYAG